MLTELRQYLTGPDQYLTNSYRLVILRQALLEQLMYMQWENVRRHFAVPCIDLEISY